MVDKEYVIITPARNEETYIEKTIQSVISQTILPKKWVIVSDGSTDRTDEIVMRYDANYDFIQLLRRGPDTSRNFASKIYAIRAGLKRLNGIEYDFIGNLDADVSFEPNYYESLLEKCANNHKLGIVGGWIYELQDGRYKVRFGNTNRCVPGAIQMFRRKCYEEIEGYIPLKCGGEDAVAEIMTRMHGWEVKSFSDISVLHHRRTGTEKKNIFLERFNQGIVEYSLGYHPLFEMAKFIFRIREKPYILGSIFRMSGYWGAFLRKEQRVVPNDIVTYLRWEQLKRLKSLFKFQ